MRRWVIAAGVAVVLVAGGAVAYLVRYRTDTTVTPVGVGEAVAELQTDLATAASDPDPAPSPVLPDVGVYTYTTRGGDHVDALGGASHTYPATSTVTVRPSGCGVTQRWTAAEERHEDFVTCVTGDGVTLVGWTEFHRFFGSDDRQSYQCSGEARPLGAAAGTTWTTTCRRDGETGVWSGEVLDADATVTVGGEAVPAEHVVWTIDNGDPDDVQRIETWYRAGTDLVLRRVGTSTTVEDSPVGAVHYGELYEITLDSLTPTR